MKKDNTILWIIGLVIVVFLILPKLQLLTPSDEFTTLRIHYYDANKKEIFPYGDSQPQSQIFQDFSIGGSVDSTQESNVNKLEKFKIEFFRFLISIGPFSSFSFTDYTLPINYARTYDDTEYIFYDEIQFGDPCASSKCEEVAYTKFTIPSGLSSISSTTSIERTTLYFRVRDTDPEDANLDYAITAVDGDSFNPSFSSIETTFSNWGKKIMGSDQGNWKSESISVSKSLLSSKSNLGLAFVGSGSYDYAKLYDIRKGYDLPYVIVRTKACIPDTCTSLGKQCGTWNDGCGGTLNCGICEEAPSYISFDIYGSNLGDVPFTNMYVVAAEPPLFLTALQLGTVISTELVIGETNKLLFNTSLIDTTQLQSLSQPINFWIRVSGFSEYTEETKFEEAEIPYTVDAGATWAYDESPDETLCIDWWDVTNTCENVFDGNYGTYGEEGPMASANLYINYIKPEGALDTSLWQIKDEGGTVNLSISSSCWNLNPDKVSFAVMSTGIPFQAIWRCCKTSDCSSFDVLRVDTTNKRVYEEAMWWKIG